MVWLKWPCSCPDNAVKDVQQDWESVVWACNAREKNISAYNQEPIWWVLNICENLTSWTHMGSGIPAYCLLVTAGRMIDSFVSPSHVLCSTLVLQMVDGACGYQNTSKDVGCHCMYRQNNASLRAPKMGLLPWRFLSENRVGRSITEAKLGDRGDSQAGRAVPSPSGCSPTVSEKKRRAKFS